MDERVTEEGGILTTLEGVATMIYCTDMLDECQMPKLPYFDPAYSEDALPEDWRMPKNFLPEKSSATSLPAR